MKQRFTTFMSTLLLSVFFAVTASAYDVEVDGLYYNLNKTEKTAEVTYKGKASYSGSIEIPSSILINEEEYIVTSIGDYAFSDCSGLTSITIPNSVTSIGNWSFSGCYGLTSITIPNSVTTIEERAFSGSWCLTSITIPNSVTSIGESAFENCYGLTSITIPNSVTSIGEFAFCNCSGLTSITIPNSVTSIGGSVLCGCDGINNPIIVNDMFVYLPQTYTGHYSIPDNVTTIIGGAFYYCTRLTSITIPNSVTTIGDYAFEFCHGLPSITIPNSVKSIDRGAFYGCSGLTSISIPNSVKSIGDLVLYDCDGIKNPIIVNDMFVYLPKTYTGHYSISDNVTTIIGGAFSHCSGLTSITIPNSVTSIGESAFSHCSGLTSITIPNSVTSIGESAFENCYGLTSITIPNSVTSIGDLVLYDCDGIKNPIIVNDMFVYLPQTYTGHYSIPDNVTTIIGGAFSHCSGLTSITIPNSVTSIEESTFSDCSGLTSITIPNSVTSIGGDAFFYCSGLTSITIPNSVTSIGNSAFYHCTRLTSITIPNSVTSIGQSAFEGCYIEKLYYNCLVDPNINSKYLKEMIIGDNTKVVQNYFNFAPLSKIVLGKNVTHIKPDAFLYSQLEEFTITGEEPPYLYPNVFGSQDLSNATLYVPESKVEYYQTTEPWSNFGKVLTLSGETPAEPKKCTTPSISYSDGKLLFSCETEGAECYYTLNCQDVKASETHAEENSVTLNAYYDITCYAKAEGFVNSDVATAKLYWLTSSGSLDSSINAAKTRGVVIQSAAGFITISGLDSTEQVDFFASDGKALGSAKAIGGTATFAAQSGSVIVAKVGKESVKIAVK